MSIRIGIVGYGNLGRGVESAIRQNEDMELIGVFQDVTQVLLMLQQMELKRIPWMHWYQ